MKFLREPKKIAASLAAASLVFAACGSSDEDSASDTTVADDTETTEASDETETTEASDETETTEASDETETTEAGDDTDAGTVCETLLDEDDSVASLADLDFSGLDITVGSKDFTEQFVLGALAVVALEEGGATVTDSTNLGGTVVNRDALLAGEIDTYFEYNGTGWTVHLAQEDPSFDREELSIDVCNQDLADNGIRWVGLSPFSDTYGFATAPDSPAAGVDLQGMMDYVNENADATVCMEVEFPSRPDGLVLLEEYSGLTIPEAQVSILDTGVIYNETANGNCTFGEVFTTDGRIPALSLDLVEDPGVFILYNVSMTMPNAVYDQAPEAFEALADTLLGPLDEATIAELNRRVSADGEEAIDVARDFLTEQGLI